MDNSTVDKLKHTMNTDCVRRLLIKFFRSHGFEETLDRKVFPPLIQSLTLEIPQLATYVELEPSCESIDNINNKCTISWSLFVLGNHRMNLGQTYHNDISLLARQLQQSSTGSALLIPEDQQGGARHQSTARQIILFITRVLAKSENGLVDLSTPKNGTMMAPNAFGQVGLSNSSFYGRMGSSGGGLM